MAATTTQGRGLGTSGKPTTTELAVLNQGPSIIFTGIVASVEEGPMSPPSPNGTVVFPYTLTGGGENYVVILTGLNAGYAYVTEKTEDDDGNFTGFTFISETEGDVMYLVAKVGQKPNV